MNKFKKGDNVIMTRATNELDDYKKRIGKTATIESIDNNTVANVIWDDGLHCVADRPYLANLELVQPKAFTKQDLKERWLVKLKNGEEAFLFEDTLCFIKDGKFTNETIELDDYKNDLTCKIKAYAEHDIVEIFKPHYDKVWTRTEDKPIEMTISEIEKALDIKNLKIVAEED